MWVNILHPSLPASLPIIHQEHPDKTLMKIKISAGITTFNYSKLINQIDFIHIDYLLFVIIITSYSIHLINEYIFKKYFVCQFMIFCFLFALLFLLSFFKDLSRNFKQKRYLMLSSLLNYNSFPTFLKVFLILYFLSEI